MCCVLILDPSSHGRKLGKSSDCNGHCKESLCREFFLNIDRTNFFHSNILCMVRHIFANTYLIFKKGNNATSFEVSNEHIFKIKLNLIQCTSTIVLFMFNQCMMMVMQ